MAAGPSFHVPFPPSDMDGIPDTLYLSKDGRELEIDKQQVTPYVVARAFEVSYILYRETLIYPAIG